MKSKTDPVVTLEQLLASRDQRAAYQKQLLEQYGGALLCFLVNYPGSVKRCETTLRLHQIGRRAVEQMLCGQTIAFSTVRDLPCGIEGYWCVQQDPKQLKSLCCSLEEQHPLGRLFDLDVLGVDGVPLSRTGEGKARRACIICGEDPTACRRLQRHSIQELTDCIDRMLQSYDQQ